MGIETQGIQDLILTIINAIANFDIKTLNFDFVAELLTKFAPIWNPIWVAVSNFLETRFGF
ncbi:MAG: hypothetical protein MJ173_09645 [Clostridia bacterium]|nr:hypothetical protein [Clostridia bacterium]